MIGVVNKENEKFFEEKLKEQEIDDELYHVDLELHTAIYKEISQIFAKYGIGWRDAFIISAASTETTIDEYTKLIRESYLEEEIKKRLLESYAEIKNTLREILPSITKMNVTTDQLMQMKCGKYYRNTEGRISKSLKKRFKILYDHRFACVYCGRRPPQVELQLEHLQPRNKGGTDMEDNLVPACKDCNLGKSNMEL